MTDPGSESTASPRPSLRRCPRCLFSLRGLPANHACPECGLRYDEQCKLYTVANPQQVLIVWMAIFASGWIVLKNLPKVPDFFTLSTGDQIETAAAVLWIVFVALMFRFMIKRYRQGYEVALTAEGLIIRLPAIDDKLIRWERVADIEVKSVPGRQRDSVLLTLSDPHKRVPIGGLAKVFSSREEMEEFVARVQARRAQAMAASGGDLDNKAESTAASADQTNERPEEP